MSQLPQMAQLPPARPARHRTRRLRRSARALSGPVEGEVTRVRKLAGPWRWLLIVATAATILLCINQQFTLRFFVGYTQLNTEYYYLLILCMLPFTFLIFPGTEARRSTECPGTTRLLFVVTVGSCPLPDAQRAQGGRARLGVRRRADAGDRARGFVDVGAADGGAAPHRRLEPAVERPALHGLSAVCRRGLARPAARATSRRSSRRPPTTCSPARACSASRSRPSPRP